MDPTYTYVEGANLTAFIFRVREAFSQRFDYDNLDDARRPHTIRSIGIELFDGLSATERLAVIADLDESNGAFIIERPVGRVFEFSDSPQGVLTDLVAEVVQQVLHRDSVVREEDERRLIAAGESLEALRARWHEDT